MKHKRTEYGNKKHALRNAKRPYPFRVMMSLIHDKIEHVSLPIKQQSDEEERTQNALIRRLMHLAQIMRKAGQHDNIYFGMCHLEGDVPVTYKSSSAHDGGLERGWKQLHHVLRMYSKYPSHLTQETSPVLETVNDRWDQLIKRLTEKLDDVRNGHSTVEPMHIPERVRLPDDYLEIRDKVFQHVIANAKAQHHRLIKQYFSEQGKDLVQQMTGHKSDDDVLHLGEAMAVRSFLKRLIFVLETAREKPCIYQGVVLRDGLAKLVKPDPTDGWGDGVFETSNIVDIFDRITERAGFYERSRVRQVWNETIIKNLRAVCVKLQKAGPEILENKPATKKSKRSFPSPQ